MEPLKCERKPRRPVRNAEKKPRFPSGPHKDARCFAGNASRRGERWEQPRIASTTQDQPKGHPSGWPSFQLRIVEFRLSCSNRSSRLEAFPAKDRAPLCRPERNRSFFTALRAGCLGFRSHLGGSAASAASAAFGTLRLACLASLGFVLEPFVGEEHLFAGCKNKLSTALRALQDFIVVFHEPFPLDPSWAVGPRSACTFGLDGT